MIGAPDELRQLFDRLFIATPHAAALRRECFIGIRAGGDRLALRLSELAGLEKRCRVVPLPGCDPALLGLAGIRRRLVPVYDLAALLGCEGTAGNDWRWVGLCWSAGLLLGLAFDMQEDFIQTASTDAQAIVGNGPAREHIHEIMSVSGKAGQVQGVVSVASILAAITQRARGAAAREETGKHGA